MRRILLAIAAVASLHAASGDESGETPKQAPPIDYPFTTCVVSGETLGERGEPDVFVRDGHEIKLCCPSCRKRFDHNVATFLRIIDEGVAAKKRGETPVNPAATAQIANDPAGGAAPRAPEANAPTTPPTATTPSK